VLHERRGRLPEVFDRAYVCRHNSIAFIQHYFSLLWLLTYFLAAPVAGQISIMNLLAKKSN
jgi:hypothetical protein